MARVRYLQQQNEEIFSPAKITTVKPRKILILEPVKKQSFAKTIIFKLLLDSYSKTVIWRAL